MSKIKLLYKEKSNASDSNSYRGIALECTLLKVFPRLLTQRLTNIIDRHIPEEQFGFRKNCSTTQAVECLSGSQRRNSMLYLSTM